MSESNDSDINYTELEPSQDKYVYTYYVVPPNQKRKKQCGGGCCCMLLIAFFLCYFLRACQKEPSYLNFYQLS